MKYLFEHSVLIGKMSFLSVLLVIIAVLVIAWCVLKINKLKKEKQKLEENLRTKAEESAKVL